MSFEIGFVLFRCNQLEWKLIQYGWCNINGKWGHEDKGEKIRRRWKQRWNDTTTNQEVMNVSRRKDPLWTL